ncbi:MAG: DUF4279 domain-containing protein [Verrucomicrobium sp.]
MRDSQHGLPPQGVPEGTIWFGGPVDEASVLLRIYGDDLDPEEITRLLGCEPWDAGRMGELKVGAKRSWTVRRGYWKLHLSVPARSRRRFGDRLSQSLARAWPMPLSGEAQKVVRLSQPFRTQYP